LESTLPKFSLTQKQQAVYDFIQSYFVEYRCSPLIREIQLGCRITSYKSAIDRLNTLERKGYIKRVPNKHRGIKLFTRSLPLAEPSAEPTPEPAHAHETAPTREPASPHASMPLEGVS